jgi:hypothetical protein
MPSEAQRVRAIVEWRLILDEFQPKIIALTLWRAFKRGRRESGRQSRHAALYRISADTK